MRTMKDEVGAAVALLIENGLPFSRADVMATIPGQMKTLHSGASIGAQVDKEIRAQRDAGAIAQRGVSDKKAALWQSTGALPTKKYPLSAILDPEEPEESPPPPVDTRYEPEPVELDDPVIETEPPPAACSGGVVQVQSWMTTDGKLFGEKQEAEAHQSAINVSLVVDQFLATDPPMCSVRATILAWEAWRRENGHA